MSVNNTVAGNFKNEPSKRFYEFIRQKIEDGQLTNDEVSRLFRKGEKEGEENNTTNNRVFLSQIKNGRNSVTIDQVLKAQYHLKLSPGYLFGEFETNPTTNLDKDTPIYTQPGDQRLGAVLHSIFKKHETEVKAYAKQRLNITEQQMHNYFTGKSRLPLDVVLTICQDHNESLDLFRSLPLPKGHLLEENKRLKSMVDALQMVIKSLQHLQKTIDL